MEVRLAWISFLFDVSGGIPYAHSNLLKFSNRIQPRRNHRQLLHPRSSFRSNIVYYNHLIRASHYRPIQILILAKLYYLPKIAGAFYPAAGCSIYLRPGFEKPLV